jgi:hypothetical protein
MRRWSTPLGLLALLLLWPTPGSGAPPASSRKINLWEGRWVIDDLGFDGTGGVLGAVVFVEGKRFSLVPFSARGAEKRSLVAGKKKLVPKGRIADPTSSLPAAGTYEIPAAAENDVLIRVVGDHGLFDGALDLDTFSTFTGDFIPLGGGGFPTSFTARRLPTDAEEDVDDLGDLFPTLPGPIRRKLGSLRKRKKNRARLVLDIDPERFAVAPGDTLAFDVSIVNRGPRPIPSRATLLEVRVGAGLQDVRILGDENMATCLRRGEPGFIDLGDDAQCQVGPLGNVPAAKVRLSVLVPESFVEKQLALGAMSAPIDSFVAPGVVIPEQETRPRILRVKVKAPSGADCPLSRPDRPFGGGGTVTISIDGGPEIVLPDARAGVSKVGSKTYVGWGTHIDADHSLPDLDMNHETPRFKGVGTYRVRELPDVIDDSFVQDFVNGTFHTPDPERGFYKLVDGSVTITRYRLKKGRRALEGTYDVVAEREDVLTGTRGLRRRLTGSFRHCNFGYERGNKD